MKTTFKFYLLILGMMAWACNNPTGHDHGNHQESAPAEEAHDHADEHGDEHSNDQTLRLNGDQRWEANPETTEGIKNMQSLIKAQLDAGAIDLQVLKPALEQEFSLIFKRCTMTGEAHNQLHNYLIPLKSLLEEMDGNEDPNHVVNQVNEYLAKYFLFFV